MKPPESFDPALLFSVLNSHPANLWVGTVTGLKGGDVRAAAVGDIMIAAYYDAAASTSEAAAPD